MAITAKGIRRAERVACKSSVGRQWRPRPGGVCRPTTVCCAGADGLCCFATSTPGRGRVNQRLPARLSR